MARWARGEAEIEQLLQRRELEIVTGAAANGKPLLDQARSTAATAATLTGVDAYSAYILAYDAARFAGTALLAQQGLRPTTSGGHTAVATATRAQFGPGFRSFNTMRRRRNELEYPTSRAKPPPPPKPSKPSPTPTLSSPQPVRSWTSFLSSASYGRSSPAIVRIDHLRPHDTPLRSHVSGGEAQMDAAGQFQAKFIGSLPSDNHADLQHAPTMRLALELREKAMREPKPRSAYAGQLLLRRRAATGVRSRARRLESRWRRFSRS